MTVLVTVVLVPIVIINLFFITNLLYLKINMNIPKHSTPWLRGSSQCTGLFSNK